MLFLVIFVKFLILSSVLAKNLSYFEFYGMGDPRKRLGNYTNLKATDYPILKPKFDLPKNFDARQKWPECKSFRTPEEQGMCSNCWANNLAGVLSDRWCVAYGPKNQRFFSADDLTTCCQYCLADRLTRNGCFGGDVDAALHYWITVGICSGGQYETNIGCKPYSDSLFFFRTPGVDLSVIKKKPPVPCKNTCYNKEYPVSYQKDRKKGHDSYIISNDTERMQWEIFFFGSVVGTFLVTDDFLTFDTNEIFMSRGTKVITWHGVTFIGWGEENGVPYWLVRNSWGPYWGNNGGFYRLKRGVNMAHVEETIYVPIVDKDARTKTIAAAASTTTESSKSVSSSDSGLKPSNVLPVLTVVYIISRLY